MKKNVVYILSFISKSIEFELVATLLDKGKFNLSFILLHDKDSYMEDFLKQNGINTFRINYTGKKDAASAIFKIRKILKREKTDIVHCHLFDACFAGLVAAKSVGVRKRIHTRHNSTIHHAYHPGTVKYDKLINRLSTDIIAVSSVVKDVLVNLEGADASKISIIHHGFNMDDFDKVSKERMETIQAKYNFGNNKPVVGVISRFIHWKGVQYIIPAFKKLLEKFPSAHLVLANAEGPYADNMEIFLAALPAGSFTKILFEDDVYALFKTFDLFVHTPIDKDSEAFGQVYVEAMASKVPSVVTLSGIANDYIKDNHNAAVVPFKNSDAIYQRMVELLNNKELKESIVTTADKEVRDMFPISKKIKQLEALFTKDSR